MNKKLIVTNVTDVTEAIQPLPKDRGLLAQQVKIKGFNLLLLKYKLV